MQGACRIASFMIFVCRRWKWTCVPPPSCVAATSTRRRRQTPPRQPAPRQRRHLAEHAYLYVVLLLWVFRCAAVTPSRSPSEPHSLRHSHTPLPTQQQRATHTAPRRSPSTAACQRPLCTACTTSTSVSPSSGRSLRVPTIDHRRVRDSDPVETALRLLRAWRDALRRTENQ